MRGEDKEIIRDAEIQTEQAVAAQVVQAAPGIIAALASWIKRKLGGLLALVALLLAPHVLLAADIAVSGSALLGDILTQVVIPAAGSLLLLVLTALAAKLKAKTGLEISQKIIDEAVHYAEAAGNEYLIYHSKKMPSAVAQQLAVEYALERGGKRLCGQSLRLLRHNIDAAVQRLFNQDRDYNLKYWAIDPLEHKYRRPEPEHIDDNQKPVPTGDGLVSTPSTSDTTGA